MSKMLKTLIIGSVLAAVVACHHDDGKPAPDQGAAPPPATVDGSQAGGTSGESADKSSGTDAGQGKMQRQDATQSGMHPTDPQQPPPTDRQQH